VASHRDDKAVGLAATASIEPEIDLSIVDGIVARLGREPRAVLPILQAIQARFRYVPESALRRVCETTDITPARITGVASFYEQFRFRPLGRYHVRVCHGTACHVAGAPLISEALRRHLGIEDEEEDTTADRLFTIEKVACLGCCSLAPVMMIDDLTYGHLSPELAIEAVETFGEIEEERRRRAHRRRRAKGRLAARPGAEIRVGMATCCIASGSLDVKAAIEDAVRRAGLDLPVKPWACPGMSHHEPIVEIAGVRDQGSDTAMYGSVSPQAARAIVRRHFRPAGLRRKVRDDLAHALGVVLDDAAWPASGGTDRFRLDPDADADRAFLAGQEHIVLEHRGRIDPLRLDAYRGHDGYRALATCLRSMTPAAVIDAVGRSGLRGRGGGGFPTGRKWAIVRRQAENGAPYFVMNGDEGDPGAFMDRMLLESYPHRVLEGLIIAAYAIGARQGYLYIRAEYPLAIDRMRRAIDDAQAAGLLGDGILGADFSLHLQIVAGAGAFVCGEETGLIASIEGRRGMPRFRPPYPAEKGLWGRPTCINNVETLANVPWIIRNGPEAFAAFGTEHSAGTKIFALAGWLHRSGLIEVPMGTTIREIVEEIGGGLRDGRRFKAVQIGGPSGGCIPARLADTPIDYEALTAVGAMMGSGGLVVLDDTDCMVDMARYFLEFTERESCGRCTFCRVGTKRMLEILDRLCTGEGKPGDLDTLEHLADRIRRTSLCALGRTAPNPVITTLRYFRDEYEAHLEGRCPTGTCRALVRYVVTDKCIGCTICAQNCPVGAIEARPYEQQEIDPEKCTRCGQCAALCPADAIIVESPARPGAA